MNYPIFVTSFTASVKGAEPASAVAAAVKYEAGTASTLWAETLPRNRKQGRQALRYVSSIFLLEWSLRIFCFISPLETVSAYELSIQWSRSLLQP